MLLHVLILLLAAVTQGQGFYQVRRSRSYSRCSSSNTPCRLKFELYRLNNTLISRSATQTCSCNSNEGECSSDWTDSDKVISRNLRSETMIVNLNMMFCSAVTPSQVCGNNEVSLEISGSLTIPNDLDNYNCRCSNSSQPLYLIQRSISSSYRFQHKYVCADSWPTCSTSDDCMKVRSSRTDYYCECPSDKRCRMDGALPAGTIESLVACSSR